MTLDNLRASMAHGLDGGDRETTARIAASLQGHWARTERLAEGQRWLARALDHGDHLSLLTHGLSVAEVLEFDIPSEHRYPVESALANAARPTRSTPRRA